MKIFVKNKQKSLSLQTASVKAITRFVLEEIYSVTCDQVSIHFVSTKTMQKLHEDFFDDPSETDCISFPIDSPWDQKSPCSVLGEIFVCPNTAIKYTDLHGGDPLEETTLYIVHGLLHLLGYDDIDPKDRKEMRKQEKKCLSLVKSQGLGLSP
ncbi:MAG: rRNA maturation RNase YbeY [Chlamydiae bacterium]|nr:rRNA maturation RNase YbeY [Chlamydiota bacterium]